MPIRNVTASYNALRAAIEAGITRISQISSINAIGAYFTPYRREFQYLPLDEAHRFEPADPYSLSKMCVRPGSTRRMAQLTLDDRE